MVKFSKLKLSGLSGIGFIARRKIFVCSVLLLSPLVFNTSCSTSIPSKTVTGGDDVPLSDGHDTDEVLHEQYNIGKVFVNSDNVGSGIIDIKVMSDKKIKVLMSNSEDTTDYIHVVPTFEEFSLPLQVSGLYTIQVMENISNDDYLCIYEATCSVELDSELSPWLHSNMYSLFDDSSDVVHVVEDVCVSDQTFNNIGGAFEYIITNVEYDYELAKTVQSGYIPNPDRTINLGSGICYDYSSLTSAMLRCQGIPCRMVIGYVDDSIYHAWNEVWVDGEGWVSDEYYFCEYWNRSDLTFSASGINADYIQDDSRYRAMYYY